MRRRLFMVALLGIGLTACGGGGSGAFGGGGSKEAFCAELGQLDANTGINDLPTAVEAYRDLLSKAPSAQVRDAMSTILDALAPLSDLDAEDPDMMSKVFEAMLSPEVMAAGEFLSTYLVEECGISEATDPTDMGYTTDSTYDTVNQSISVMDDIEAGDLSDAVEMFLPEGFTVSSTSLQFAGDYTLIELTVSGDGDVDGVALCEQVQMWLASVTSDEAIELAIYRDGDTVPIGGYPVGGTCAAG